MSKRTVREIPAGRDLGLDAMRAFLALGVLFAHSIHRFSEDSVTHLQEITTFFQIFRVPAFYFLSGFLIGPAFERIASGRLYLASVGGIKLVYTKFRQLIIPTLLFTLVPSLSYGAQLLIWGTTPYYFLPALFYIIVWACILYLIIRSCSRRTRTWILLSYATATTVLALIMHYIPAEGCYFHWRRAIQGNLFFILGLIAGLYPEAVAAKAKSKCILLAIALADIALYILITRYAYILPLYTSKILYRIVVPLLGVALTFGLFSKLSNRISHNSKAGRLSYYLGQRSLPLYLMQDTAFLLVFGLIDISASSHSELIAVLVFALSALLTLAIHDLICLCPIINKGIFGRKKHLYSIRDIFASK